MFQILVIYLMDSLRNNWATFSINLGSFRGSKWPDRREQRIQRYTMGCAGSDDDERASPNEQCVI